MNGKSTLSALAFILLAASTPAAAGPPPPDPQDLCFGGNPGAQVKIEVYSDFQCPACKNFYMETIRPVLAEYGRDDKICVVYHEFPLRMHRFAREAARFALAGQRLGRSQWVLIADLLYTHQDLWAENGNIEAVLTKGLTPDEMARLKSALKDPTIEQAIDRDIASGTSRQVTSTPTFFVTANGKEQRVVGGLTYPILKDFLDRMLR